MEKDPQYTQILEDAKKDPGIIGFILAGGRGKGFATEYSDYDCIAIVEDDKEQEYREMYHQFSDTSDVYVKVFSVTGFREYAKWGSDFEWDRYSFAHLKALVDKTGEIQKIVDEKGMLPAENVKEVVLNNLDAYINSFHRSMKNHRDGDDTASFFDAAESIPLLLTALFALESRIKPYNKFLEWEFKNYPLQKLSLDNEKLIRLLVKIVSTGEITAQKEVFDLVIKTFADNGFENVIKGWDCYYMG